MIFKYKNQKKKKANKKLELKFNASLISVTSFCNNSAFFVTILVWYFVYVEIIIKKQMKSSLEFLNQTPRKRNLY